MEKLVYVDRRNTNCNKWDGQQKMFGEEGLHAMWVADMDFMPPQCIQNAICSYVKANPLGYTMTNPNYIKAVINWYKRRHNCGIEQDWLIVIFKKNGLRVPPMSLLVLCGVLGLSQNQTIPSPF